MSYAAGYTGGSSGAPAGATPYVVTAAVGGLSSERILTQSTGVTITDNGAGSTVTVAIGQSVATTASPTFAGLTLSTTPLAVASGGTGLASWTANGIVYASGATTLANSANLTYDGTTVVSTTSSAGANMVRLVTTSATTNLATDSALLRLHNTSTTANNYEKLSFTSVGSDGTTTGEGAVIACVNTARGAATITADLVFLTTNAGTAATERARITGAGVFQIASLTSGRVAYVTTSGGLTDSSNLTYDGTTIVQTTANATANMLRMVTSSATTTYATDSNLLRIQNSNTTTNNYAKAAFTTFGTDATTVCEGAVIGCVFTARTASTATADLVVSTTLASTAAAEVARWNSGGGYSITQAVNTSGSPFAFQITGAAHTTLATGAEASDVVWNFAQTKQFAQGNITTQRAIRAAAPTWGFATSSSTVTNAIMWDMGSAASAGTNAVFTSSTVVRVGGAATIGATAAGMTYSAIDIPAHTITVTGTTQVTSRGFAGVSIGQITVSDASAVTVDTAASLYIANAPTGGGGGPAAITTAYAIWVDAGLTRLDGTVYFDQTSSDATPMISRTSDPDTGINIAGGNQIFFSSAGSRCLEITGNTVEFKSGYTPSIVDGTVGAPGLRFINSTTTGLYSPGAGILGLVAAGAEIANFQKASTGGGWMVMDEADSDPGTSQLDASDSVAIYNKSNKIVFSYNLAGVINFLSCALDGSTTTWVNSTTAP